MGEKSTFLKSIIPIFMSTFIAWFYASAITPLGYIYNSFPGQDSLVMSIATIPGITAMVGAFGSAALINFIGRKPLILSAMIFSLAGGLIVRYFGEQSIYIAIFGSAITGFSAGVIPAANISALSDITPANLSDKIFGINDAITTVGLVVANALAGVLAANGEWVKAWDVYWLVAVAIVMTVIWYPSNIDKGSDMSSQTDVTVTISEYSHIPGSIIALIIYKFVIALFYMALSLNISALIINELEIGTSVHVGTLSSLSGFVGSISMILVFLVLKICKKKSVTVTVLITAIAFLLASTVQSILVIGLAFCIAAFGINAQTSSITTVIGNATKGRAAGTASGLLTGAMFLGEALCGYVPNIVAGATIGTVTPSGCIKVSAYFLAILAILGYIIYSKAYMIAFPDEKG